MLHACVVLIVDHYMGTTNDYIFVVVENVQFVLCTLNDY